MSRPAAGVAAVLLRVCGGIGAAKVSPSVICSVYTVHLPKK
jgi:hypothetical protein